MFSLFDSRTRDCQNPHLRYEIADGCPQSSVAVARKSKAEMILIPDCPQTGNYRPCGPLYRHNSEDLRTYREKRPVLFRGRTDDDFTWFLSLVFRHGRLTIGAPTSPAISNALCFDLDVRLDGLSQSSGVVYTRYADDLFFSTSEKNVLTAMESQVSTALAGLDCPRNLSINEDKTRHNSKKGARRVTGIVLGSDGQTHVGRKLKRAVRADVHKLSSLSTEQRSRLAGMISFVIGFDPEFMNALIKKYSYETAIRARYGSP